MSDDSNSSPGFSAESRQIADLAVKIMQVPPAMKGGDHVPIDEPMWDAQFDAALRRAKKLLREIDTRSGTVSAYQLFEEGEWYSAKDIAEAFKTAKWNPLTSPQSVEQILEKISAHFDRAIEDLADTSPSDQEESFRRALETLNGLYNDPELTKACPKFRGDLNRFISHLDECPPNRSYNELLDEHNHYQAFRAWCFTAEPQANGKEAKKYRAHEIFRFAKIQGWEGNSLEKELRSLTSEPDCEVIESRLRRFERFTKEAQYLPYPDPVEEGESSEAQ